MTSREEGITGKPRRIAEVREARQRLRVNWERTADVAVGCNRAFLDWLCDVRL